MNTTFYAKAHKSGNSIVVTIPYNLRTVEAIEVGTRLKVTIQKLDNKTEDE